jgi:hypothetical protein
MYSQLLIPGQAALLLHRLLLRKLLLHRLRKLRHLPPQPLRRVLPLPRWFQAPENA